MQSFSFFDGRQKSRVVITCEHASNHIPEYGGLGVGAEDVADHIGWDIGAAGSPASWRSRWEHRPSFQVSRAW
jgi:predicted N-formylglutamate amidohydrolase